MAKPFMDIKILGVKELQRDLKRLDRKIQRKIVSAALRDSAKRVHTYVDRNLSGHPVSERTGALRAAFKVAKVRAATRKRSDIRLGIVMPDRAELGIAGSDRHFFPYALEYGHKGAAPRPFLRPAVDQNKQREFAQIGRDIGRAIEKAWALR